MVRYPLFAATLAALLFSACSEAPGGAAEEAAQESSPAQAPGSAPQAVAAVSQTPPDAGAGTGMSMTMTITKPQPAAHAGAQDHKGMTARNFRLTDQFGTTHELHKMTDTRAIVIAMQGVGCPIVRKMTPDLKEAYAAYKDKGVAFYMINANIQDSPDMIRAEAEMFEIDIPILKDPDQKTAASLKAVRTAEYYIIEPGTWKVLYHGPINDRLTYGRERARAENTYLSDRLDMILAGQAVEPVHMEADGCIINYVNT